jgi:hypothetical protein
MDRALDRSLSTRSRQIAARVKPTVKTPLPPPVITARRAVRAS